MGDLGIESSYEILKAQSMLVQLQVPENRRCKTMYIRDWAECLLNIDVWIQTWTLHPASIAIKDWIKFPSLKHAEAPSLLSTHVRLKNYACRLESHSPLLHDVAVCYMASRALVLSSVRFVHAGTFRVHCISLFHTLPRGLLVLRNGPVLIL